VLRAANVELLELDWLDGELALDLLLLLDELEEAELADENDWLDLDEGDDCELRPSLNPSELLLDENERKLELELDELDELDEPDDAEL
jgi:hypothetical protein